MAFEVSHEPLGHRPKGAKDGSPVIGIRAQKQIVRALVERAREGDTIAQDGLLLLMLQGNQRVAG